MNDLTLSSAMAESFPSLFEGLKKAQSILDSIKSFEDVERIFLMGQGLSPHTYRSYLTAVKQFYDFTKGLNPLQVRPGDIEAFYDSLVKHTDRNTAYIRIKGLKKFFSGIRNLIPFYTSPFEVMGENLRRKLRRTKKGNRTKKTLTVNEINLLLSWLRNDTSIIGLQNYAIIFMLITSGLRASELCQLSWKHLDFSEDTWTANFTGKGNKSASQELYTPAVDACLDCFKKQFKRDPLPDDALFRTIPAFKGDDSRPLKYHTLWYRVSQIGNTARAEGIIKRDVIFSPHLMRRTYATVLYKSGMGLKAIQEKTRHANIEVLVKHYIHDEEKASPYFQKIFQGVAV
jgi:integrase/recombinase XerD